MILGLAPMDGITDCAYRIIVKRIFDKYNKDHELGLWTEFMNSDWYTITPEKLIKHMMCTEYETWLIAQIYWGNEEALVKAAKDLCKKYWDRFKAIELNIGCPSPKVMACGWGSGMMKDKTNTLNIIKKIKSNISLPFTIKTRIGLTSEDWEWQKDFIVQVAEYCDIISIHGRYYKQAHGWEVDWDKIYELKEIIWDKCKIIGNWWVTSYQDALDKQNNLDGIMIGQWAIGNPWIFVDHEPTLEEKLEVALDHLNLSVKSEIYFRDHSVTPDKVEPKTDTYINYTFPMPTLSQLENYDITGKAEWLYSTIEFRKFLFNYVKGIPGSKDFKVKVSSIKDYGQLIDEINKFFLDAIQREKDWEFKLHWTQCSC